MSRGWMTRARTVAFASAWVLLFATPRARAQGAPPPPLSWRDGGSHPSAFARDVVERAALALLELQYERVPGLGLPRHTRVERERRLAQLDDELEQAQQTSPDDASVYLTRASVQEERERTAEAIASLAEGLTHVGEGPERADLLFRLGVESTRALQFERAREAYEAYLALPLSDSARAAGLCNLAETYTYLGDPDRSIDRYRDCIVVRPLDNGGWWGLASALDRAWRTSEAEAAARRALELDPDLNGLSGPGVFFVPPYESHYYFGLAFEAEGDRAEAVAHWTAYLAAGGEQDRWASRVRAHLRRDAEPRGGR